MVAEKCSRLARVCLWVASLVSFSVPRLMVSAQEPDHAHMAGMNTATGWQVMQDAVLFAEYDHQGSDRGGNELVAPNWWMGMARRHAGHGEMMLNAMFSLDPALVGRNGYGEIFQSGEALGGRPIVDRQHPHDFFMQLSASWRIAATDRTAVTLTAAPVGAPALGPTAFMHRASATDNPTAPLGHHTLDSTHVSFGVVTAAVDRGKWTVEGSLFNGREPDEHRWNVDLGRLDSFAGRLWFRPSAAWALQVSSGRLTDPEALEPGNIVRTTASVSWIEATDGRMVSATAAYGRNDLPQGSRSAALVEGAAQQGPDTVYLRFEGLQVETLLLETDAIPAAGAGPNDVVYALTSGMVRDLVKRGGIEAGVGGDLTVYLTPDSLKSAYGAHPVSAHLFIRIRPSGARMWNMGQMMSR